MDLPSLDPPDLHFPSGFFLGAATAAYQVEGGIANNNWAVWERTRRADGRRPILGGQCCGRAADHWRLFEEDLERMRELGLSMYRFSVEWSRIEPEEGRFDEQALARYRGWCEKLGAAGITPMVTLHHFSEPDSISQRGGFENHLTVDAFGRFARFVVPRLAGVVDYWVTVNEPVVYPVLGWLRGEFPPCVRDGRRMVRVLEHLLLAHAEAYHLIHELDSTDADGDGVAALAAPTSNIVLFEPSAPWNPVDRLAARLFSRAYNEAVLDALETGRLRLRLPGLASLDVAHSRLAGTWDFAGVNHYFRLLAGLPYLSPHHPPIGFNPSAVKNDMGWDLVPETLYDALRLVAPYGKPIWVTENGTCDDQIPDHRRA